MPGLAASFAAISAEGQGAEVCQQQKDADQESEVADAVDDECFLAGVGGGVFLEPEADEQVGSETDAFPSDEHEQSIAGQDKDRS